MNFFVDSISGDNANDGLTPATAIADIFAIDTDAATLATYWVRRGSTFTLASNGSTITKSFGIIVSYPTATDEKYADRPQAAIDAGWDNDASTPFLMSLNRNGASWVLTDSSFGEHLEFYNVEFEAVSNTAITALFTIHAPYLKFYNCDFKQKSSSNLYLLSQGTTGGGTSPEANVIEFSGCKSSRSGAGTLYVVVATSSGTISYTKRYKIKDSDMGGVHTAFYIAPGTHAYTYDIEVENSRITSSGDTFFFRTSTSHSTSTFHCHVHSGSRIISTSANNFQFGNENYQRVYRGNIELEDSIFVCPGSTLKFNQRQNNASNAERLDSLVALRCEFSSNRVIDSYAYARMYVNGDFIFEECKFIGQSTVFYLYGTRSNNLKVIDARFDRAKNFLYTESAYYSGTNKIHLSFKGQTLLGNIANFISELDLHMEDSIVYGDISTADTAVLTGEIVGSEVGAIGCGGVGDMKILGSRVSSPSGKALENIKGTIVDSQILSQGGVLFDNDKSSLMIEGTTFVCAGMGVPKNTAIRMLRSTVNSVPAPFSEVSVGRTVKSSPIYRVGGADYSLHCSLHSFKKGQLYTVPNIYGTYVSGKNLMSLFLSSVDEDIANIIEVRALFIEGGVLKTITLSSTPDASSWSGITQSVTSLKYTVDLSSFSLLDNQSVRFLTTLQSREDDVTALYLDPMIKGE